MIVGELFQRLGLKIDNKSFSAADQRLNKVKSALRGVVAGVISFKSVQALANITSEVAKLGDELDKTSGKLGVATGALQELRFAGGLAGLTTGQTDRALEVLGRRASEAALGLETAERSFKDLGVSVKDSSGTLKPIEQLLEEVQANFGKASSQADKLRITADLFGRSAGPKMINLLKEGSAGLAAMRLEARELGGVLSERLIKQSVEFNDNFERLGFVVQGVRNVIGESFIPVVVKIQKALIGWFKQNQKVIRQKLGRFFRSLANAMRQVAFAIAEASQAVVARLGPATTAMLALASVVALLTGLFGIQAVAIGAVALLLGLIIQDFKTFEEGGESVTGKLKFAFEDLIDQVNNPALKGENDLVKFLRSIKKQFDDLEGGLEQSMETLERWGLLFEKILLKIDRTIGSVTRAFTKLNTLALRFGKAIGPESVGRFMSTPIDELFTSPTTSPPVVPGRMQRTDVPSTGPVTQSFSQTNNITTTGDPRDVGRAVGSETRKAAGDFRAAFKGTRPADPAEAAR